MVGLGEFLRSQREASGLTLDEISALTRISTLQLRALEDERFEELPGGVFNVSFVRQFARAIGADEAEAVNRLKAVTSVTPTLPYAEEAEGRKDPYLQPGPTGRIAQSTGSFMREHGGTLSTVIVGLLLLVGGAYSYEAWEEKRAEEVAQAEADAVQQERERKEALQRAELAAQARASEVKAQAPKAPIDLRLEVVETVWIRASADGERVLEGTFREGVNKPILARESVTLKVGNAGGVRLALNGERMPPIGPRGHVRSVRITPDGVEVIGGSPEPGKPAQTAPASAASARDAELAWTPTKGER